MTTIHEHLDADLIELGAASVETKGGQELFGEPDGRSLVIGLLDD